MIAGFLFLRHTPNSQQGTFFVTPACVAITLYFPIAIAPTVNPHLPLWF